MAYYARERLHIRSHPTIPFNLVIDKKSLNDHLNLYNLFNL